MRILAVALLLLAGGCIHTVATVVTAPVRATAKVVDWTTTSPSERDRNYIRRRRKAEEREARERRAWAKHCQGHEAEPRCQQYTGFRADQPA